MSHFGHIFFKLAHFFDHLYAYFLHKKKPLVRLVFLEIDENWKRITFLNNLDRKFADHWFK